MALPFKYYILNEQEIESGALDLRYYTRTQADTKYVFKETGKTLIESTILSDLTDGGNTTLHTHDNKADKLFATNLVTNGDFSNGTTGWSDLGSTLSVSSNKLIITGSGSSPIIRASQNNITPYVLGKKIYFRVKAKLTTSASQFMGIYMFATGMTTQAYAIVPLVNTDYIMSTVLTATSGGSGNIGFQISYGYVDSATANGKVMEVQYVSAIDLTSIFGAGKEPTKEQMDWLLAQKFTNSWFNGTAELTSITDLLTLVNTKADITQEAWITPTLLNGWTNNTGGLTSRYKKDTMGVVWVELFVNSGTTGSNIFQLPIGYRPTQNIFITGNATGIASGIVVGSNGDVTHSFGANTNNHRYVFAFRTN